MPLENYLLPNENVLYNSERPVSYMDKKFWVYITERRLILYRISGIIFKKEEVFTENLRNLKNLHFNQIGTIRKKGVLRILLTRDEIEIRGKLDDIRALFQHIQRKI